MEIIGNAFLVVLAAMAIFLVIKSFRQEKNPVDTEKQNDREEYYTPKTQTRRTKHLRPSPEERVDQKEDDDGPSLLTAGLLLNALNDDSPAVSGESETKDNTADFFQGGESGGGGAERSFEIDASDTATPSESSDDESTSSIISDDSVSSVEETGCSVDDSNGCSVDDSSGTSSDDSVGSSNSEN